VSVSRIWPASDELDRLIDAARHGSPAAQGRLFEACREYVLLVANRELGRDLRAKVGPSDLVQETFVQAQQGFPGFEGASERELLGWLRGILLNQVLRARRHFGGTVKRDISREVSWNADSSLRELIARLPGEHVSPEDEALAKEQSEALYTALEGLPAHYRQVLVLRYWQGLTFVEIGERIGRSAAAVRKIWVRAVDLLDRAERR
jgi:RNA polymerase sigma-70 factor, ECF subfamily